MARINNVLLGTCACLMVLGGCATTAEPVQTAVAPVVEAGESVEDVAETKATVAAVTESGEAAEGTQAVEITEIAADDKLVCRREARTGSNFKTRICKTTAEWARDKEQAQILTDRIKRIGTQTGQRTGG